MKNYSLNHSNHHCVGTARIRSFSGPYFFVFGLITDIWRVNLHIQFKCEKICTRKSPNTDSFDTVHTIEARPPKFLGIMPFVINRLHEILVHCKKNLPAKIPKQYLRIIIFEYLHGPQRAL